jgi:uncharacterized delta-60 repeat protein
MKGAYRASVTAACAALVLALLPAAASAATPGKLDRFFSGDGKQTAFVHGATAFGVAIDAKGRIVVAGYTLRASTDFAIARFLPNGRPDHDFGGGDGRVTTNLGGTDYAFDVAIPKGGGIVVAGERDASRGSKVALVRYNASGGRDKDFGGGDGIVLTSFGKRYNGASALAVGANGNISVGGFTSNGSADRWALARYGPRGVLDKDFGKDGKITVALSASGEQINDLTIANGGIVAAGYVEAGLTPRFAIARFGLRGGLDRDFGHRGVNTVNVSNGSDIAYTLAQGPDGSFVTAGYAANGNRADWGLVRFGPRGRIDDTFSGNGIRVIQLGPQYEYAYGVTVQGNGRTVVVGRASRTGHGDDFGVFRLKVNGAFDESFGNGGKTYANFFSQSDTARDVALQASGKIVVAGETTKHGVRRFGVARFIGS